MNDDHQAPPDPPRVDIEEARRFLDLLDRAGVFTFQTYSDREELKQVIDDGRGGVRTVDPFARVRHGSFDRHASALTALNQSGAGVFVMVNEGDGVVKPPAKTCRTTANVIAVRALFVDLDGAPITPVLTGPLPPDWVVESSPRRWHAYWRMLNCPLNDFTAAQLALAARFGGDPTVSDLPRVLRVPGFIHQKVTPFMSKLHLAEDYSRLLENERV